MKSQSRPRSCFRATIMTLGIMLPALATGPKAACPTNPHRLAKHLAGLEQAKMHIRMQQAKALKRSARAAEVPGAPMAPASTAGQAASQGPVRSYFPGGAKVLKYLKVCLPICLIAVDCSRTSQEAPGVASLSLAPDRILGLAGEGLMPSALQVAQGLGPAHEALEEAGPGTDPVQVLGHGQLSVLDPTFGERAVAFGFTAASTAGPVAGFLAFSDRLHGYSFSGDVREVTVLERDLNGAPMVIRISGVSTGREEVRFSCTVVGSNQGQGDDQVQVSLSVSGSTPVEVALSSTCSGYISINGVQQRTGREQAKGWAGWHGSGLGPWQESLGLARGLPGRQFHLGSERSDFLDVPAPEKEPRSQASTRPESRWPEGERIWHR